MTNPLLARPASAGGSGGGPMNPGDVRTIHAKDPKTGEITKTFTLHRTARPYAYDLADAYNAELTRDDIEWAVGENDQIYLRDKQTFTSRHTRDLAEKAESERQRWKYFQERKGEDE